MKEPLYWAERLQYTIVGLVCAQLGNCSMRNNDPWLAIGFSSVGLVSFCAAIYYIIKAWRNRLKSPPNLK